MSNEGTSDKGPSFSENNNEVENLTKGVIKEPKISTVENIRYKCPQCPKSYKLRRTLHEHLKTHDKNKQIKCEVCWKICLSKHGLIAHMRTHTGQKPFACPTCDRRFGSKDSLKTHRYIHLDVKLFKCKICPDDRYFRSPQQLRSHMIFHRERRFKCLECNKMFHTSSYLREHQLIHLNLKPHECRICQKRFTRSYQLQMHVRSHTGEKPHVCPIYKKMFTTYSNMKRHTVMHTGEKPHKCDKCDRSFRWQATAYKHWKKCGSAEQTFQDQPLFSSFL